MAFTTLYLRTQAPTYTPATIQGAWDDTAGAVTKALDPERHPHGGGDTITYVDRYETSTTDEWDVLLYRGISGPLAAQTISGTIDVIIGIWETNTNLNANWHLHVYITQGDSDTPRGTLLTDYREAAGVNEWPTTEAGRGLNAAATLTDLAIQLGDRLVVELGYAARNTSSTSYGGRIRYGTTTAFGTADDLTVGSTSTASLAGQILFSDSIAEAPITGRITQTYVEAADPGGTTAVRTTQAYVETALPFDLDARVSQLYIELPYLPPLYPCPHGPTGEDPCQKAGYHTWIEWGPLTSVTYVYSNEPLPDALIYYGGFKAPEVLDWGRAERALSDDQGHWEAARMTIQMTDVTRAQRARIEAQNVIGTPAIVRFVSQTGRVAQVLPRTIFAGEVRAWGATGDVRFSLELRDALARIASSLKDEQRQFPRRRLSKADFPNLPDAVVDQVVPIYYGVIADWPDTPANIQGMVVPIYVGETTLLDTNAWHTWVVAGHAVSEISAVVTGTLTGGDRTVMVSGDGAFGTTWLVPGETGWAGIVGSARYLDANGRRYTVIYGRGADPDACAAGTLRLAVNLSGIETVGDGTGGLISDLFEAWLHFLVNYAIRNDGEEWQSGAPLDIPLIHDGICLINADSFYLAAQRAAARVSGGYPAAVALDRQEAISDILAGFARSTGTRFGTNEEGQLEVWDRPDTATLSAIEGYTDKEDIFLNSFGIDAPTLDDVVTHLTAQAFRVPDGYTALTGITWNGLEILDDTAAQGVFGTIGGILELPYLYVPYGWETVTIDGSPTGVPGSPALSLAAFDVASRYFAWHRTLRARIRFRTTPCKAFAVDLGSLIRVTHFAGPGAGGWTDQVCQVERLIMSPNDYSVEIEAVDLSTLVTLTEGSNGSP